MDRSRLGTLKDCAPRKRTTLVSHCSRGTSILETTIWLEKSYSPGHSPAHLGLLVPHLDSVFSPGRRTVRESSRVGIPRPIASVDSKAKNGYVMRLELRITLLM